MDAQAQTSATLGDVLYADTTQGVPAEEEWVALLRSVAAGDQAALHALYERAHRPVFTLLMRLARRREAAEALTVEVFRDVWWRASAYDPAAGSVLAWIMGHARARALERMPRDAQPEDGWALREALAKLTREEREVIETAYFCEFACGEVASSLGQPLDAVKARIRSGLHKLRQALSESKRP
jgi:RNA polymerase sigma-70 factor (ECF subfamily)